MKVKNLILGGLLLTATFAACTNEELVEVSQPQTGEAVALGEDFTIMGGFSEVLSRAIYKEESASSIKSLWEPNDSVGGAWYAAYQSTNTDGSKNGFGFNGFSNFASNHPYSRVETTGNLATAEFSTITNAFAGKYVLYYPYDATVAKVSAAIPVKIETAQVMDVANPLAHVNENMFAYANVEYTAGGNQASDFELSSVPVLFRLQFKANETTRGLIGKTISKVVIQADKAAFVAEGEVKVSTADGASYDKVKAAYSAKAGKTTNVYTLDVIGNANKTDYQVTAVGANGGTAKAFYIAMLPVLEDALDEMTIKVITTDGDAFAKTITGLSVADNDYEEILAAEGGFFNYAITLDEVADGDDESIYTLAQFNDAWAAALKSSKTTEINLGAPITMESLELAEANKNIKITGALLTVDELSVTDGHLTIDQLDAETVNVSEFGELNVVKVANIDAATIDSNYGLNIGTEDNDATVNLGTITMPRGKGVLNVYAGDYDSTNKVNVITGKIEAGQGTEIVLSGVGVEGAAEITGTLTTNSLHKGKVTVKKYGAVNAEEATFAGGIDVAENAYVNSEKAVFKNLTNNGVVDIRDAEYELADGTKVVTFNGTTLNGTTGTIVISNNSLAGEIYNGGTFTNRGLIIAGEASGSPVTTAQINNAGTMTLDAYPIEVKLSNEKAATLNVACADDEDNEDYPTADLNIANAGTMNVKMPNANLAVTIKTLSNNGTVNIERGTVEESTTTSIEQEDNAAINVKTGTKLQLADNQVPASDLSHVIVAGTGKVGYIDSGNFTAVTTGLSWIYTTGTVPAGVSKYIVSSALTVTDDNAAAVGAKPLYLRANVTFKNLSPISFAEKVYVEAEIEFAGAKASSNDSAWDAETSMRDVTFGTVDAQNGGLLKVGSNMKVTISTLSSGNIVKKAGAVASELILP